MINYREIAIDIINNLSEEQIIDFIRIFSTEHTPNKETLKAIEELEAGIGLSKPFNTVDELMEDLNAED